MWRDEQKTATLWWRDDDAQLPSAQLDRLIDVSVTTQTPLVLATIPHGIDEILGNKAKASDLISIVQHGYAHTNHAPPSEKKCEFGNHRALDEMQQELIQGADVLTNIFGDRFIKVLVPPWNRISLSVAHALEGMGYVGLSTFGNALIVEPSPGFHQINTHVDLINWRGDRGFIGTINALQKITSHLYQRRSGHLPIEQPTGILTHHLVHDEELWQFLEEFLQLTSHNTEATWLTGSQVFNKYFS